MLENPQTGSQGHASLTSDSVVDLASRALLPPVQRQVAVVDPAFVRALQEAALCDGRDAFTPVLAAMRAARLSDRQIADDYVPVVARQLGDGWNDDTDSFTAVTIGVARLYQLLPRLGAEWRAETMPPFDAPAVLLIVGHRVDHMFGAKLVLGQLRRCGLSVRLVLGCRPADIGPLMAAADYSAVMLSAAIGDATDPLRQLIAAVRAAGPGVPVVIGGGLCSQSPDLCRLTGADHMTCDVDEALRLCGLAPAAAHARYKADAGHAPRSMRA